MRTVYSPKKSAPADWHLADIKAGLEKAGWTLRRLSLVHGYSGGTLKKALHTQYPRAEEIIAATIGVHPSVVWPSRYNPDGSSTRAPTRRGQHRRPAANDSALAASHHVNVPGDA